MKTSPKYPPSRTEKQALLAVARGDAPGDLLIRNLSVLDLVNGDVRQLSVQIVGQWIAGVSDGQEYEKAGAKRVIEGRGLSAVPGFIDGHVHLESSLMNPFEFEKETLVRGTTTAICDPHEITNVLGAEGFAWFLRCAELLEQNLFVQVSSCVPALEGFETNGGVFDISQMQTYKAHPYVLGLAEMMNYPGVVNGIDSVLDKLEVFEDMNLDGHCPQLRGLALNAYIGAGIRNCHETISIAEGREKLQKGMALILREGSVAKNLRTLAPLVSEFNSTQCFLCTDDRNPLEIRGEGHIDGMIRRLIGELGWVPHLAYRLASFSPARHFGLKRLGLIAPGQRADLVLLRDLQTVQIEDVLISGRLVSELELGAHLPSRLAQSKPPTGNSIRRAPLSAEALKLDLRPGIYRVIEVIPEQIVSPQRQVHFTGGQFSEDDILPIANIERYGQERPAALGLVKGFGLTSGALASSVAHDSHNLMVVGTNAEDMAMAVNELIKVGGGFCACRAGETLALVELPVAGLMSLRSADELQNQLAKLRAASQKLGCALAEPFLQLAFLALPVIPELKLTDRGLVDVTRMQQVLLQIE